ncbi:hypothetical protein Y1Q_0021030 [Alligator mississippiensis]|uniref:Centrosomal protein of 128 kDa n=1 Tax=Alligator mississippiensis TaxID=8496 RepID=A0A151M5F9_ALLMI|nr:hypothetical protein Y1Q_0021030 [Alligator mississippiensis]
MLSLCSNYSGHNCVPNGKLMTSITVSLRKTKENLERPPPPGGSPGLQDFKTSMAESSSDSDSFRRHRVGSRGPLRATHIRARNHGTEEVTEKIHTLASTLQDTNRNLKHVDQMLGQYREYNREQTEAIATLKETLEESISQLRSQRLSRNSGMRSASLSSLCTSDLDGEAIVGSHHFQPTSPLRDYGDSRGTRRRRSRSATVRFVDETDNLDQLHCLHQSLRDLTSEQVRLGDDISRELSRRNRTDAETKKTLAELSEKIIESQRQETKGTQRPNCLWCLST